MVAHKSLIELMSLEVALENCQSTEVNPLMGTLKPHSNRPIYSNTIIGTVAVDKWAVTFGIAMRELAVLRSRSVLSSLYQI